MNFFYYNILSKRYKECLEYILKLQPIHSSMFILSLVWTDMIKSEENDTHSVRFTLLKWKIHTTENRSNQLYHADYTELFVNLKIWLYWIFQTSMKKTQDIEHLKAWYRLTLEHFRKASTDCCNQANHQQKIRPENLVTAKIIFLTLKKSDQVLQKLFSRC